MRFARLGAFALGCFAVGCGSSTAGAAPPTTWRYSIDFQSKDAAVAVDTLEIDIFAPSAGACPELVSKRRSDQTLKPIAHEGVGLCDVLMSHAGEVTVPYGDVSVLVVAKNAERSILIGCSEQSAGSSEAEPPVVTLTNFDETIVVQESACVSVTQHCAHQC